MNLRNLLIFAALLLSLMGCAGSKVVSNNSPGVSVYKINSASVIWKDNITLPYKLSKYANGYVPSIDGGDLSRAKANVSAILIEFRKSVGQRIYAQLPKAGNDFSKDVVIEITPVSVEVVGGEAGNTKVQEIVINAIMRSKETGRVLWSATIKTHGDHFSNENGPIVQEYADALVKGLKGAGWAH